MICSRSTKLCFSTWMNAIVGWWPRPMRNISVEEVSRWCLVHQVFRGPRYTKACES